MAIATPTVRETCAAARRAALAIAAAPSEAKDAALEAIARLLEERADDVLEANEADLGDRRADGLTPALRDRLTLTRERVGAMADGVRAVAALPDPVGELLDRRTLASGLELSKVRVPLGVVAVVYEARPNVTVDCAALTIKSANAIVLRGSRYAERSNGALAGLVREGIAAAGNCHVYVHADADLEMARRIVVNAKVQRPGVCNAAETLLVNAAVAAEFLPAVLADLRGAGVALLGDERAREDAGGVEVEAATEADWDTEYLDLRMAVAVVDSLEGAIEHVNRHGTRHSEAIVTRSEEAARRFSERVDAAVVYTNASTRFTDGFEFGMGAEIGNSTQKLHARGPIGLRELTTYKYIVRGDGQVRE